MQLLIGIGLYCLLHILIWFSCNTQFMTSKWADSSLIIALLLSIPITLTGYYAAKLTYQSVGSAWNIRFIAFGLSYLVFPILTYWLLNESMFTPKTVVCIMLSFLILWIQLYF